MFSRVFRRNTETEVTDDSGPVEPTVQASSNGSPETPSSGSKRKNENSNYLVAQPTVKYQRFEFESEDCSNSRYLFSGLVSYIDKYIWQ